MFFKKVVQRYFAKFTENRLRQSLFLIKFKGWDLQLYKRRDSHTGSVLWCPGSVLFGFTVHVWTTTSVYPKFFSIRNDLIQISNLKYIYTHFWKRSKISWGWGFYSFYLSQLALRTPFSKSQILQRIFSFINPIPYKRRDQFHFCCHVYFTICE